jgi:hypothetical protein
MSPQTIATSTTGSYLSSVFNPEAVVRGARKHIDWVAVSLVSALFLKTRGAFWSLGVLGGFIAYKREWDIASVLKNFSPFLSSILVTEILRKEPHINSVIQFSDIATQIIPSGDQIFNDGFFSLTALKVAGICTFIGAAIFGAVKVAQRIRGANPVAAQPAAVANNQQQPSLLMSKPVLTLASIASGIIVFGAKTQWNYSWLGSFAASCIPFLPHFTLAAETVQERVKKLSSTTVYLGGVISSGILLVVNPGLFCTIATTTGVAYGMFAGSKRIYALLCSRIREWKDAEPQEAEAPAPDQNQVPAESEEAKAQN